MFSKRNHSFHSFWVVFGGTFDCKIYCIEIWNQRNGFINSIKAWNFEESCDRNSHEKALEKIENKSLVKEFEVDLHSESEEKGKCVVANWRLYNSANRCRKLVDSRSSSGRTDMSENPWKVSRWDEELGLENLQETKTSRNYHFGFSSEKIQSSFNSEALCPVGNQPDIE